MGHKFDIDKHALDQELRDRIRAVIRGLQYQYILSRYCQGVLDDTLANLQPVTTGTNIGRLKIGHTPHWDNSTRSSQPNIPACALVLLRQLIVNYWGYVLNYSDESLPCGGGIENYLETLEGYVEKGLDKFVVVGSVREGFWLMWKGEYQRSLESVR